MKRLVLISTLAVAFAMTLATAPAAAQGNEKKQADAISIPVVGTGAAGTFSGVFNLTRFVATDSGVVAVGTLTGTLTSATGVVTSIVRVLTLPVLIGTTTCDILHLDLGPLSLDLLGLQVDLSRIVLDITAEAGAGNLLGNLLCAVAGLLDNPGGLAKLLNQILSILG